MNAVPDTKLAKEALHIVKHALSENIFNHSMRVFYYGINYGKRKDIQFIEEELYLVSLFHDLGFYHPFQIKGKPFQLGSSTALRDFLVRDSKTDPKRINALMEAIDFHFQFKPRWDKGEVAGLLQTAAHMDVLGKNSNSIDQNQKKLILKSYPKKRFFLEFNLCLLKSFTNVNSVTGLLFPERCCDSTHYLKEN